MTAIDPHAVLGVAPGAPPAEIKRAYRALAKAFHPDTAGESAIPRFLAIQAAYEALMGESAPGRRAARRWTPPAPAWQADPERARATRESWNARTRRRADPNGARRTGRAGERPSGPSGPGHPPGAERAAGGGGGAGASSGRGRDGGRRNKATLGSTSYDGAEAEVFDPDWSGASWYGQSSGTFWTINPKEYADPRKHGPEYQARARRRTPIGDAGAEGRSSRADVADDPDAGPDAAPAQATGPRSSTREWRMPAPPSAFDPPVADPAAVDPPWRSLLAPPTTLTGRIGLALVGWPPIGIALVVAFGELTGCARFAATCDPSFNLGTWAAQLLVIALLAAVPLLAAIAASGTLAALAAAVPAAILLSALGGGRDPASAGAWLAAVLAVAWLVGAAAGLRGRSGRPASASRRRSPLT